MKSLAQLAMACACAVLHAQVYSGRAGQLAVRIPRLDAHMPIDGTLSAPVWEQAALLTGFSEYKPVDGLPAEDSTEVLVWYSKDAIYFGIRAVEAHGPPHATQANRDQIDGDDNVQVIVSPFVHSHQALVFAVNPFGVQEDGTITEGVRTTIGVTGIATGTGPDSTDLSSDFVYESKGQLTPFGYQVEVRVPFRSIKFPATSPQDWGLNIVRKIQHSGHSDTWYPTKLAAASYLDEAGTLVGLHDMDAGLVLDLNPIVTEQAVGTPTPGPTPGWSYGVARPQFGANVRWGITSNLLLNGTYRPDFAEVESDATQLSTDPRVALQYPAAAFQNNQLQLSGCSLISPSLGRSPSSGTATRSRNPMGSSSTRCTASPTMCSSNSATSSGSNQERYMTSVFTIVVVGVCGALAGASVMRLVAAPGAPGPAPAYLISNAETITDTIMVKQYGASVGKTIRDFDGTFLVSAASAPVVLDSSRAPKGRFVIIRFPSMERLQEWYNSPAYAAIRSLRERSTTGAFFALQGIPTP